MASWDSFHFHLIFIYNLPKFKCKQSRRYPSRYVKNNPPSCLGVVMPRIMLAVSPWWSIHFSSKKRNEFNDFWEFCGVLPLLHHLNKNKTGWMRIEGGKMIISRGIMAPQAIFFKQGSKNLKIKRENNLKGTNMSNPPRNNAPPIIYPPPTI